MRGGGSREGGGGCSAEGDEATSIAISENIQRLEQLLRHPSSILTVLKSEEKVPWIALDSSAAMSQQPMMDWAEARKALTFSGGLPPPPRDMLTSPVWPPIPVPGGLLLR